MKAFLLVIIGAVASQELSIYENCTEIEQCNYSCDSRENCFGTGRRNNPDTACCGESDMEELCASETLETVCLSLPANLTLINGGFNCK